MSEQEKTLIGILELNEAKRWQSILGDKNVELEFHSNPNTCARRGCSVTVEIYAHSKDLPVIAEFIQNEKQRALEGLEVDTSLFQEVFDTEKETARCPACGKEFNTTLTACPDCGLVFIPDGST